MMGSLFNEICFAEIGWLEPLLDRIVDNPASAVTPMIAGINMETLKFEPHSVHTGIPIGIFTFELTFNWKWLHRNKTAYPGLKIVDPVRFVVQHQILLQCYHLNILSAL